MAATVWFIVWVCSVSLSFTRIEGITCSRSVSTLGDISGSESQEEDFTLCLNMGPGRHYRNHTSPPITYSFVLAGNNAVIQCDPMEPRLPMNDYTRFPFVFQGSEYVQISDVVFEGCQRPLQFLDVVNITLRNVRISNFSPGGAVEIFNSPLVLVENCLFTNNTSEGIGTNAYSGNSGALAVGYNDTQLPDRVLEWSPRLTIVDTKFLNNSAWAAAEFKLTVAQVLKDHVYNQRGGAIAVYYGAPNYSGIVSIVHCELVGNSADSAGGAVYMYLTGENNSHIVNITGSEVSQNYASDGGGVEITFDTSISYISPNQIYIDGTNFTGNRGVYGGAIKFIQVSSQGNFNALMVKDSMFSGNMATVGSALYFQSRYVVSKVATQNRTFVDNCSFFGNVANRGVVFAIQNTVALRGGSVFRDNIGPSIRVLNSLLSVSGDMWFVNNHGHREGFSGTLYLSSFGQLLLHRDTNMTFINNTGSEGACIVAKRQTITAGFAKQLYNPQCFLVYEDPRVPPPMWEVKMKFSGNRALVGPVVYISNLDACQWYSENSPFFSMNRTEAWSFIDADDNYVIRGTEYMKLSAYNIQTEIDKLQIKSAPLRASPGDYIEVEAVAVDQFDHNTSAFLDITTLMENTSFEPSIVQTVAGQGVVQFKLLSDSSTGNTTVKLNPSFTVNKVEPSDVVLVKQDCLPGYFPSGDECVCEETEDIILCPEDRKGLLLADGLWGAPPNYSRVLVTYTCPPGYCNCSRNGSEGCLLLFNESNYICDNKREGTLCGTCREGYGVGVLSSSCRKYKGDTPQYYWLIPIYLIVVIPTLLLIVRVGVRLPSQLKGFLLYIQIADISVRYLPESFNLLPDVIDSIGSALALYLPYDFSFHPGLSTLESYGLRLVTPIMALIVVPIAVRIRYQSRTLHGVWTLVLLMFVMAVETSVSLVFCPTLERTVDGHHFSSQIWFFDGSVECYVGLHLFLFIIAILLLLFLALMILTVALVVYHHKLGVVGPRGGTWLGRMEKCSKVLTAGVKEQYIWWPIVELFTRYLFVITVVLSPGYKSLALLMVLAVLSLHSFVHPYESVVANHSKSFALLMLVILLAAGNTTELVTRVEGESKFTLAALLYLPIAVGGLVFIALIGHRLWSRYATDINLLKQRIAVQKPHKHKVTGSVRKIFTTTSVSFQDLSQTDRHGNNDVRVLGDSTRL